MGSCYFLVLLWACHVKFEAGKTMVVPYGGMVVYISNEKFCTLGIELEM